MITESCSATEMCGAPKRCTQTTETMGRKHTHTCFTSACRLHLSWGTPWCSGANCAPDTAAPEIPLLSELLQEQIVWGASMHSTCRMWRPINLPAPACTTLRDFSNMHHSQSKHQGCSSPPFCGSCKFVLLDNGSSSKLTREIHPRLRLHLQ